MEHIPGVSMTLIIGPSGVAALSILHFMVTPTACFLEMNCRSPMRVFAVALFPLPVFPTRTMFLTGSNMGEDC